MNTQTQASKTMTALDVNTIGIVLSMNTDSLSTKSVEKPINAISTLKIKFNFWFMIDSYISLIEFVSNHTYRMYQTFRKSIVNQRRRTSKAMS